MRRLILKASRAFSYASLGLSPPVVCNCTRFKQEPLRLCLSKTVNRGLKITMMLKTIQFILLCAYTEKIEEANDKTFCDDSASDA